jgi:hypothetical protein
LKHRFQAALTEGSHERLLIFLPGQIARRNDSESAEPEFTDDGFNERANLTLDRCPETKDTITDRCVTPL